MNVLEAIKARRSVRKYSARPIEADVLDRIKQSLRFAPSACNFQPWKFIIVDDPDQRNKVTAVSNGQNWMADAPVIIVACGFPDDAYKKMGGYGNSVEIDVAIAIDHLTLAAVAEGLGTCWIGAFDEAKAKQLLSVPDNVKIIAMTPLGYPDPPELIHDIDQAKRKSESQIFSNNNFD